MTDQWIKMAEDAYSISTQLIRKRKRPLSGTVCFYCNQCRAFYLKAYLVFRGDPPAKTVELVDLMHLCTIHEPGLISLKRAIVDVNPYTERILYPGYSTDQDEARHVLQSTRQVRQRLRRALGL